MKTTICMNCQKNILRLSMLLDDLNITISDVHDEAIMNIPVFEDLNSPCRFCKDLVFVRGKQWEKVI